MCFLVYGATWAFLAPPLHLLCSSDEPLLDALLLFFIYMS